MKQMLDAHNQAEADAEGRGDDHREIQDNGTQGKTSYKMGDPSGNHDFPTIENRLEHPVTIHPDFAEATINEFALTEGEVTPHNDSIANYGIEGPPAGGGLKRNTKT